MLTDSARTIGRYQIRDEVGRGMMGVVYRAVDPDLERHVALKTIQLAFPVSDNDREAFEKRFLAEARAAAALSHPGIVVVHDVGRDARTGTLFIALEHLQGRTMAELAEGGRHLEWRPALRLTAEVARALHHAHERGIVHRDVKPANIMVLDSGEAKLMDFGIARLPASQLTSTREFLGTPAYMSPEQLSGEALDGRTDLFSLAAVLYLLLTGRKAFDGGTVAEILARILHQDPVPPSRLVPGLPPALDDVLSRGLAKKREARYPDGRALAADLESLLGGEGPLHAGPAPEPMVTPPARWRPRVGRRGFMALGGLAIAGLGATVLLRGPAAVVPLAPPPPPPPARLEIRLQHSLRAGVLRVWLDDVLVAEEPLKGRVTEDLLLVKLRKGTAEKTIEVPPGEHALRVEVSGDGFSASRRLRETFEGGATRRLNAAVGGFLRKELRLWWEPLTVSPDPGRQRRP